MFGLDTEAIQALGVFLGTAVAALVLAIRGAMNERARQKSNPDPLGQTVDDARGEIRQLRQELRIEHRETRKRIEDEHRETREAVASIRDLAVELRAYIRTR